jgi:hypothetical protein
VTSGEESLGAAPVGGTDNDGRGGPLVTGGGGVLVVTDGWDVGVVTDGGDVGVEVDATVGVLVDGAVPAQPATTTAVAPASSNRPSTPSRPRSLITPLRRTPGVRRLHGALDLAAIRFPPCHATAKPPCPDL